MADVDLDSRRAAKGEARREPHTIRLLDTDWSIAASMPLDAAEAFSSSDMVGFWFAILDEDQHEAFRACKPTVEDVTDLIGAALECYGLAEGESSASTPS